MEKLEIGARRRRILVRQKSKENQNNTQKEPKLDSQRIQSSNCPLSPIPTNITLNPSSSGSYETNFKESNRKRKSLPTTHSSPFRPSKPTHPIRPSLPLASREQTTITKDETLPIGEEEENPLENVLKEIRERKKSQKLPEPSRKDPFLKMYRKVLKDLNDGFTDVEDLQRRDTSALEAECLIKILENQYFLLQEPKLLKK